MSDAVALRKESVDRNFVGSINRTVDIIVALRKESVDRNRGMNTILSTTAVALRKESVDRNTMRRDFKALGLLSLSARRAWIEIWTEKEGPSFCGSLSARRAWIEISRLMYEGAAKVVALRKESVDRNTSCAPVSGGNLQSLSARRAWIEIRKCSTRSCRGTPSLSARRAWIEIHFGVKKRLDGFVALRKESVDRNRVEPCWALYSSSRSPQGERG